MSPGPAPKKLPAFARIGLSENPEKNQPGVDRNRTLTGSAGEVASRMQGHEELCWYHAVYNNIRTYFLLLPLNFRKIWELLSTLQLYRPPSRLTASVKASDKMRHLNEFEMYHALLLLRKTSDYIRRPEFECSGPQLEGPEFECSGPQLEGPEFEYSELSLKCPAEPSASARHHNVKTPKFDGTTSWAIFRRQFEAIAEHNGWTPAEKTTQLLAALQGQASEILHSVPEDGTAAEIMAALEGRYGDHQLAAAFRTQLKTRVQQSGESLQEFAMAVEQLAHKALRGLPNDFIAGEAAYTFGSGVRDPEIKQQLLLAEHRTINAALAAALRMEAAKLTANVSASHRIRSVAAADVEERQPKSPERRRRGVPTCWSCGEPGHLRRDCDRSGHKQEN
ncbi:hypothetical protein ANN_27841 [Periplaneta americana]|uniref:CCHC-type domain-containing protein n=1 Tax=Periplaneta americana TaxID=6978 RepID=A0ABQ8RVG8_PERAM|nr:hypothetical protein ANN_27841 [Periplaneta americana]